ncbi:MAG: helix-turn-helix domain-containing protein [Alphaproteobacteria bacterium]|nr:MAG: helix-turn-helix domain-containing protein [Alphaproteobacteria bacterium]
MELTTRFAGLSLSASDREVLLAKEQGSTREKLKARDWRRIRTLLLLDEGCTVRATAEAVGGYPREISRVGKRYLAGGLQFALSDDPRPKPEKMLDSAQQAAIVAMVCGPAPEGRARWTVRLVAEETVRRGIVGTVGRETVRGVLANHGLKPWREKNVVRAGGDGGVR